MTDDKPLDELELSSKAWLILIFVLGLIFGMAGVMTYQAHLQGTVARNGADYVEYRMNHLSEIRNLITDQMTIGQLKDYYWRYNYKGGNGASRMLLESEVNKICSGYKVVNQTELDNKLLVFEVKT